VRSWGRPREYGEAPGYARGLLPCTGLLDGELARGIRLPTGWVAAMESDTHDVDAHQREWDRTHKQLAP